MKKKIIYLIFLVIFMVSIFLPNNSMASDIQEQVIEYKGEETEEIFSNIKAPNLLLAETNTSRILYERASEEKIYPASITKLMTAILVVENCELDEIVTVSENAVRSVSSGYVNANLQVGEQLTVEDLMYVMLIPSANDAANALAEHVGGSIDSFSTMMNTRARELGCTGSNFTNPSGLHQEKHYTTTKDLYLIAKQAISNSFIKKVIGTTNYTLPSTNKYTKTKRMFTTTNYMKRKSLSKYYCDYCIGGKTGYTGEAKNCVVEFAKKDGIELIAIVMGETGTVKGQKFLDAKEMLEYVFKNYKNNEIISKNDKYEIVKINNGTKETRMLNVVYKDDIEVLQKNDNQEEPKQIVEYYDLKAPIEKGTTVGKITYEYKGETYTTDLVAENNVEESKVLRNLLILLIVALLIYIIHFLEKSKKKYRSHGKNYKKRKAIYY